MKVMDRLSPHLVPPRENNIDAVFSLASIMLGCSVIYLVRMKSYSVFKKNGATWLSEKLISAINYTDDIYRLHLIFCSHVYYQML